MQQELVLNHSLTRDAARKRIQRAHELGIIKRFIRLKAGGYMCYLPDAHSMGQVVEACKSYLEHYRPRLARIIRLIDKIGLVSLFEVCRLAGLKLGEGRNQVNPAVFKILEELQCFGISLKSEFLLSSSLDRTSIGDLVREANKKFEEEANLLYTVRERFLRERKANEITLYRTPTHHSLVNKFDAIGWGGYRKKATILIEFYSRRLVFKEDCQGYQDRIWSTISKKKFPKPVFCYLVATSLSDSALNFASQKKMKVIRVEEGANGDFMLRPVAGVQAPAEKVTGWRGRLADAQGLAFEAAVEKAFRRRGCQTQTRKMFYLRGNEITEEKTKHRLTDIDVFASKPEEGITLVECRSAKGQISRSRLMQKVKSIGAIADYLSKKQLPISAIMIGNCNKLDILDAKRKAKIPVAVLSPMEFYQQHKKYLEGEPRWLFEGRTTREGTLDVARIPDLPERSLSNG